MYDKEYTEEERSVIEDERNALMLKYREKQKRAHRLAWDFIEHNIQSWWD